MWIFFQSTCHCEQSDTFLEQNHIPEKLNKLELPVKGTQSSHNSLVIARIERESFYPQIQRSKRLCFFLNSWIESLMSEGAVSSYQLSNMDIRFNYIIYLPRLCSHILGEINHHVIKWKIITMFELDWIIFVMEDLILSSQHKIKIDPSNFNTHSWSYRAQFIKN